MGFSGTAKSVHFLNDLLPNFLNKVGLIYKEKGEHILAAWPQIVGPKLAPMTRAISFYDGILHVKVSNSTLYSLLNGPDKTFLLKKLRNQFPQSSIRAISFRMN